MRLVAPILLGVGIAVAAASFEPTASYLEEHVGLPIGWIVGGLYVGLILAVLRADYALRSGTFLECRVCERIFPIRQVSKEGRCAGCAGIEAEPTLEAQPFARNTYDLSRIRGEEEQADRRSKVGHKVKSRAAALRDERENQ